ncbi:MAG: hypothetical protein PF448_06840 [Bacteroidales bacterium]|jgi:hypothetical protein|nr:hypothetical protein [Bacteroidales bacterium]
MKALTQIAMLILTAQLAFGGIHPDFTQKNVYPGDQSFTEFAVESHIEKLQIPWIGYKKIPMEEIARCGDYKLYRCNASELSKKCLRKLKGEKIHYIVYKTGNYHFAVNEYNHKAIFQFFMMNCPKADIQLTSTKESYKGRNNKSQKTSIK